MKTNDYLIKVCGLTDPHNIVELIKLEPDMIGLIFYKKSPRFVDILPLSTWFKAKGNDLLGNVKKVGVFVNEEPAEIIARCVDFDLQFYVGTISSIFGWVWCQHIFFLYSQTKAENFKHKSH